MTEVRTTSSTGGEKGMKPERYDLLPKEALDSMARVYAFGAEKYADHNWRKRYEWSKSFAAAMRHMWAFWNGETYDEESGLPHLAHAAFHLNAMMTWLERDGEGSEFDDRWINSPALQEVTEEDIQAVADDFARKYGPPPTPPAPFVEYAELAERGKEIAQGWVHPDEKVAEALKGEGDPRPLPEGWEDLGYVSEDGIVTDDADSVRVYTGSMPSETAKKLGIDGGSAVQGIVFHPVGDQVKVGREISKAIEDLKAAKASGTIRLD